MRLSQFFCKPTAGDQPPARIARTWPFSEPARLDSDWSESSPSFQHDEVSVGPWRSVVVVVLAGSAVAQSTVHCHSLPTRRPSICCSHRSSSRRLLSTVLLTPSDALYVLRHCLLPLIQAIIVIAHVCCMPLTEATFEMVGRFLAQRPYDCPNTGLFFALESFVSVSVRPTTCAPRQQPDRLKSHGVFDQKSGH